MCFYFLFNLTSALTASSLLYLASVFLYVMRISRDRSAIQSWAIFHSKETVLIHLLGLKEALYLKYHSLFHIRASKWRFNHSNGQRLTAHLHRSKGQCIGCISEKEIECYFLVVTVYLSFRIETCGSMVWIWMSKLAWGLCVCVCVCLSEIIPCKVSIFYSIILYYTIYKYAVLLIKAS